MIYSRRQNDAIDKSTFLFVGSGQGRFWDTCQNLGHPNKWVVDVACEWSGEPQIEHFGNKHLNELSLVLGEIAG